MPHALTAGSLTVSAMGRSNLPPDDVRRNKKRRHEGDADPPERRRKRKRSRGANGTAVEIRETPDKPQMSKSDKRRVSAREGAKDPLSGTSSPLVASNELLRDSKREGKGEKRNNESYTKAAPAIPSIAIDTSNSAPQSSGRTDGPALQAGGSPGGEDETARRERKRLKKLEKKEAKRHIAEELGGAGIASPSKDSAHDNIPAKPKPRQDSSRAGVNGHTRAATETELGLAAMEHCRTMVERETLPVRRDHPTTTPGQKALLGAKPPRGADKKKKRRQGTAATGQSADAEPVHGNGASSLSAARIPQHHDAHSTAEFPFFSQTTSLWLPLFPVGFDRPLESMAKQHLQPLVNHYSPILGGVLLGYSDAALGDRPGQPQPGSIEEGPTILASVDEYAVGFARLTFTAQLFVPSRGAPMEGTLILQTEGHIGVVCWDKFNASIEAKRLPRGWRFMDVTQSENDVETPEGPGQGDTNEVEPEVEQMHATGYWADAAGRPIRGLLQFRIKNFDVGMAGDNGFISIEGTMLTEAEEQEVLADELDVERRRKLRASGHLRREERRVPSFSMTRFGREDEEEGSGQRQELYKGSRPVTPDD